MDPDEYLDYLAYVEKPMDLTTVRHQLNSGYFYNDPLEFSADVELIFKSVGLSVMLVCTWGKSGVVCKDQRFWKCG